MTIVGSECKNEEHMSYDNTKNTSSWHLTIVRLECKNEEHMSHDNCGIRM